MRRLRPPQRLAHAGGGPDTVVIGLAHRQWRLPAILALAQGVHPPAYCRSPLADVQVQPLHKRGIDVLAPRRQDLRDPCPRTLIKCLGGGS